MARSTHQRLAAGYRSHIIQCCTACTALGLVWFVGCSLQSFDDLTQGGGGSAGNGASAGALGTVPRAGSNSTGSSAGASGFGAESGASGRVAVAGSGGAVLTAGAGGKPNFAGSGGVLAISGASGSTVAAGAAVGAGGAMAGTAGAVSVAAGAGGRVNSAGAGGSAVVVGGNGGGGIGGGSIGGGGRSAAPATGGLAGRTAVTLGGASGAATCPAFTGTGGTLVVPPATDFETPPEVPWVTTSSLVSPVYRVEGPGSACDGSWYLKCDPAVVARQAGWDGPAIELLNYIVPGHKYLVSLAVRFDPQNAPKSPKNIGFTISKSCSDSTVTQTYNSLLRKTTQTAWVRLDGQFAGDMPGCSLMSRLVLYVETDDTEKAFAIDVDSFYLVDITPSNTGAGGAGGVAGSAGTASAGIAGFAGAGH